ncbi:hypothetical protein QCM77_23885 [Bradyrhizobium sp. SSUT18]|uniref:His-rich protein BRANT n=1 Tax=Bradyrhizobium sp. SSUT18 TaxID=3040602 RepID=UPI0024473F1A|nr:hypothetical protein [Bradyrhizobium sp. SSUT18]MDH2402973.1 hypothetical protein [Bradyrhizobium sp. SSUT18]
MLKTISAALLAASVIAAPAFAAEAGKTTTTTPVIKADQNQTKVSTTAAKPDAGLKADAKTSDGKTSDAKAGAKVGTKSKAMNANAAVTPDEHKTVRTHRHHHKHLSAKKSLKTQPDVTKPATMDKRS